VSEIQLSTRTSGPFVTAPCNAIT